MPTLLFELGLVWVSLKGGGPLIRIGPGTFRIRAPGFERLDRGAETLSQKIGR